MTTQLREKTAFEDLVRPLLKELAGTALSLTRDVATAEDLVQEALLKAFGAFDSFEPGTNFRAWIQRILHNAFISDFRRRRRRNEKPLSDEIDVEDRSGTAGLRIEDLDAITERLDDRLKRALERLRPEFRDVFLRAAIDDATNQEIAEALGLPVGTVMSRLHRAREFLRHELAATQ